MPHKSRLSFTLIAALAFALYLASAVAVQTRGATMHFGADTHLYAPLVNGVIYDRVARFHPGTVWLAAAWMSALKPLTVCFSPQVLLKALFAAIGALGVWAAAIAFSAFMPRLNAILWSTIYASSLSVWYFASIAESKIVTATVVAAYIAVYLRLQENWSVRKAALLTGILFVGCLNEIVTGFLIVIPAVDTLLRRGWDVREGRWIISHSMVGIAALLILEVVVNGWWLPRGQDAEGASHLTMLMHYLSKNDFNLATFYEFALNWLLFSIAAPNPHPPLRVPGEPFQGSYFEPVLSSYFSAFIPMGLVLAFLGIAAAGMLCSRRNRLPGATLLALGAYSLVRGAFFFAFNPREVMLFTAAAVLPHLLLLSVPFSASHFPLKRVALLAACILLLINNGTFILGW